VHIYVCVQCIYSMHDAMRCLKMGKVCVCEYMCVCVFMCSYVHILHVCVCTCVCSVRDDNACFNSGQGMCACMCECMWHVCMGGMYICMCVFVCVYVCI